MFRLFFLGLLTLVLVVYGTLLAKEDPGYAMLSYGGYTVEMTMVLLIAGLGFGILGTYFLVFGLLKVLDIPGQLFNWNDKRRKSSAVKRSNEGFMALAEGNWRSAERTLSRNATHNSTPLLNYMAAARAAQEQGKQSQRDNYLMLAYQSNPDAETAIGLTQAELQIADGQEDQALATLMHLRSQTPRHHQVLKMLVELYKKMGSWHDLEVLFADLQHYRVYNDHQLNELEKETQRHMLEQAVEENDLAKLHNQWNKLSRHIRTDPSISCFYCAQLIQLGDNDKAAAMIRDVLKREWSEKAVELLGLVQEKDGAAQLEFAEQMLKQHKNNPVLLFSLGQISFHNQLWGKARDYVQESLAIQPSTEKYYFLGKLYETKLDDPQLALESYREGLNLCGTGVSMTQLPAVAETKEPEKEKEPEAEEEVAEAV